MDCELCQLCLCVKFVEFVRIHQLIPKQQLIGSAAAIKRTAVFTSGFGAQVEGPKREYVSSRDLNWDDVCGQAFWRKDKRVRETSND